MSINRSKGRINMIKKYFTTFLMALMLAIAIPVLAETASAQTRRSYNRRTGRYTTYKKPNFYRRHRKAINIGAGSAAGALIGGLIGGKKGLVIGGLAGAGGGALVTHKQRPKNYTKRVVRRTYRNR